MKMNLVASLRPALFALGCAIALVVAPALRADAAAPAKDAKPLPVTVTFKSDKGPKGPMVMLLKSSLKEDLKVHVKVEQSVVTHNRPKSVEHDLVLHPGSKAAVYELAIQDAVTVSAEGYEDLKTKVAH